MTQTEKIKMLDGCDLAAELESVAAGMSTVSTYLKDWDSAIRQFDQPSAESLAETLFGLERHLMRVSEDFLMYTEWLEEQLDHNNATEL